MESNYDKSNKIVSVRLNRFDKSYMKKLLACGEDCKERQRAAKSLVDYLCSKFGIVSVPVLVLNTCQPHRIGESGRMNRKTLGLYTHSGRTPISIKVWNKTAIKQQTISINVFAETLLHEFMHHYDTFELKIDTIHSAGFYKRISDLSKKLQ